MSQKNSEILLREIGSQIVDLTSREFFPKVEQMYSSHEQSCYNENKDNSIDFVNCTRLNNNRHGLILEDLNKGRKKNGIQNECLKNTPEEQCKQLALLQLKQIQAEFVKRMV